MLFQPVAKVGWRRIRMRAFPLLELPTLTPSIAHECLRRGRLSLNWYIFPRLDLVIQTSGSVSHFLDQSRCSHHRSICVLIEYHLKDIEDNVSTRWKSFLMTYTPLEWKTSSKATVRSYATAPTFVTIATWITPIIWVRYPNPHHLIPSIVLQQSTRCLGNGVGGSKGALTQWSQCLTYLVDILVSVLYALLSASAFDAAMYPIMGRFQ